MSARTCFAALFLIMLSSVAQAQPVGTFGDPRRPDELLAAANKGDTNAMHLVGRCYQNGVGFRKDPALAIEWYTKGAAGGDARSMNNLGFMYRSGTDVKRDTTKAIEWFRKATADTSQPSDKDYPGIQLAWMNLGEAYESGDDIEKNIPEAFKCFHEGAKIGSLRCMEKTAEYWMEGLHGTKDAAESYKWFLKAAEAGSAYAMGQVAYSLEEGDGVAKNPVAAHEWYTRSAIQGNAWAMNKVANNLRAGKVAKKDSEKAASWYRSAAAKGDRDAMTNMGHILVAGDGIEKNPAAALLWYAKAARLGQVEAMAALATAYETGKVGGVDTSDSIDFKESTHWTLAAANGGDANSMLTAAIIYAQGLHGPRDAKLSGEWLRKALETGNEQVQQRYGLLLLNSKVWPADPASGASILTALASKGNALAMVQVAHLYLKGLGVEQSLEKAHEWFRKAADLNQPQAMYSVGVGYAKGEGVKADKAEARKWIQMAKDAGYPAAEAALKMLDEDEKKDANKAEGK